MLVSFLKRLRANRPKANTAEVDPLPTRKEREAATGGLTPPLRGYNEQLKPRVSGILAETSQRIGGPCFSFNDQGEVFVHPDLARELNKAGNEDLRKRLLLMGRIGAGQKRRAAAASTRPGEEVNQC